MQNALAAMAVARALEMPFAQIATALRGVSRRAPALRNSCANTARADHRRRLRAPSDGGSRDDRGCAQLPSRAALRGISAAPVHADCISCAGFARRARRRGPRVLDAGVRRQRSAHPGRERTQHRRTRWPHRERPYTTCSTCTICARVLLREAPPGRARADARRGEHYEGGRRHRARSRRNPPAHESHRRRAAERSGRCGSRSASQDLRRQRALRRSRSRRTRRGKSAAPPMRWIVVETEMRARHKSCAFARGAKCRGSCWAAAAICWSATAASAASCCVWPANSPTSW